MDAENKIRQAVILFARRECGQRDVRGLAAHRVTGDVGCGGIWQCYRPAEGGGQTSTGPNIHATNDGVCERRGA